MKDPKQLIQEKKNIRINQTGVKRVYFPKLEYKDFFELMQLEINKYIIDTGHQESFKPYDKFEKVIINNKSGNDKSYRDIIAYLYNYIIGNENKPLDYRKGLLFYGSYGVGKTMILSAFIQIITDLAEKTPTINYAHSTDIEKKMQDGTFEGMIVPAYYIEDVGKEEPMIKWYGTNKYPLYQLMLERYKQKSWTFMCTNMKPETLKDTYGMYIYDRMKSMFNIVGLEAKTKRK